MITREEVGSNVAEMKHKLQTTGGAKFWAYVSPQNDTEQNVTRWAVKLEQEGGNWMGTITSDDPQQTLQTPGLSGTFKVTVTASGPKFGQKQLTPISWSNADVGCNSNCASMVGIVSNADGTDANYWTTSDAYCK